MKSVQELEARVRELLFRIRQPVNSLLHGAYSSRFHGSGLEFAEMREYVPGDEVRHIDWNASARTGRTFVKQHVEERNLGVVLVVDVSGSSGFRTAGGSRLERFAELTGLLGFCALRHRDRCGLILASDRVEHLIMPGRGAAHVQHLMERVLDPRPVSTGSDLRPALRAADALLTRRGLVFVMSDFLLTAPLPELGTLASRHQVGGIQWLDGLERTGPAGGLFRTMDPESRRVLTIDGRDPRTRAGWSEARRGRMDEARGWFDRAGADFLRLEPEQDPAEALHRWFHAMGERSARVPASPFTTSQPEDAP